MRPMPPAPAEGRIRRAAERPRSVPPFILCVTLSGGCAILGTPWLAASAHPGAGIAFWSWMFAASGCARALALSAECRGMPLPVPRLVCASLGFIAWGQLSWLVLRRVAGPGDAANAGATLAGITLYAVVALVELRAIYKAAQDARSHGS